MTPVDQTTFHVKDVSRGNCQQAAVASLLGLPLNAVPNFSDQPEGFWSSFHTFLRKRGLYPVEFYSGEKGPRYSFPCYHLAYGPSPRGINHAVVYKDNALAHDPHPSRAGLSHVDTICLIVPLDLGTYNPAVTAEE